MKGLHIEVVDRESAAILAAKSPAERVSMVFEAYRTARMLAAAGVRYLHPDWNESQIESEVARRMMYAAK